MPLAEAALGQARGINSSALEEDVDEEEEVTHRHTCSNGVPARNNNIHTHTHTHRLPKTLVGLAYTGEKY